MNNADRSSGLFGLGLALALLLGIAGAAQPAAAARADAFERLRGLARTRGTVAVIVVLDVPDVAGLTGRAAVARGGDAVATRARLAAAIGARRDAELARLAGTSHSVRRTYKSLPLVSLDVSAAALVALESSPGVVAVEEVRLARPVLDATAGIVGATVAWDRGFDGAGWHVAVLDTGIRSTHEFFAGKVIEEACFSLGEDGTVDGDGDCPSGGEFESGPGSAAIHATAPSDDHGTHVSGIAVGFDPDWDVATPGEQPLSGIARGADLIAMQVFSQFADCDPGTSGAQPCLLSFSDDQNAALDYIFHSLLPTRNIAAVNLSLGGGAFSSQTQCDNAFPATKTAIDTLRTAGVATVIATGNDGLCDGIAAPSCISSAIAVGNVTDSDVVSLTSNWHPMLDLFAPGSAIRSSTGSSDSSYGSRTGTSMAAPHVAGAFALLRGRYPSVSVGTLHGMLSQTGEAVTGGCAPGPEERRIQIDAALQRRELPASALPGLLALVAALVGLGALVAHRSRSIR